MSEEAQHGTVLVQSHYGAIRTNYWPAHQSRKMNRREFHCGAAEFHVMYVLSLTCFSTKIVKWQYCAPLAWCVAFNSTDHIKSSFATSKLRRNPFFGLQTYQVTHDQVTWSSFGKKTVHSMKWYYHDVGCWFGCTNPITLFRLIKLVQSSKIRRWDALYTVCGATRIRLNTPNPVSP